MRKNTIQFSIFILFGLLSCSAHELRGKSVNSVDDKTYLVVQDDNGGECGLILVDGVKWPYEIGEAGIIEPGVHVIECGGKIEFEISKGKTFFFDYWGP